MGVVIGARVALVALAASAMVILGDDPVPGTPVTVGVG